ncbi:MAG: polymer-forming cytoskeletal protein [Bacteriovoracia bacterium]
MIEPLNLVTEESYCEGTMEFDGFTRFNGTLKGELKGKTNSELIIGQNGVVEGIVNGDTIIVDGFVRGDIHAKKRVVISETGRVIGNIDSPNLAIKFGGFFEGKSKTLDIPEASTSL